MIYLVRQGQTDWNLFRRFNGVTETFGCAPRRRATNLAGAKPACEGLTSQQ